MTRRELLDRVGCDELKEWWAFYQVNPWGQRQDNLRMARLCVEMHRTALASPETEVSLDRFIPDHAAALKHDAEPDPELEEVRWKAFAIAYADAPFPYVPPPME